MVSNFGDRSLWGASLSAVCVLHSFSAFTNLTVCLRLLPIATFGWLFVWVISSFLRASGTPLGCELYHWNVFCSPPHAGDQKVNLHLLCPVFGYSKSVQETAYCKCITSGLQGGRKGPFLCGLYTHSVAESMAIVHWCESKGYMYYSIGIDGRSTCGCSCATQREERIVAGGFIYIGVPIYPARLCSEKWKPH